MSLCRADHEREAAAYKASLLVKKPKGMTPGRTFVNSAMTAPLQYRAMASPRPEGNNHLQHASLPGGAQIVRV